jgi:hypothetical protein
MTNSKQAAFLAAKIRNRDRPRKCFSCRNLDIEALRETEGNHPKGFRRGSWFDWREHQALEHAATHQDIARRCAAIADNPETSHFPVSFPNLPGCARSGMLSVSYAFALGEPGLK